VVVIARPMGVPLFFLKYLQRFGMFWALIPISLYSFVANFVPFSEVRGGVYLDGRAKAPWINRFQFSHLHKNSHVHRSLCRSAIIKKHKEKRYRL